MLRRGETPAPRKRRASRRGRGLLADNPKLLPRLALALFDDPDKAGDVYGRLKNSFGPWQVDTVKLCNEGAHKGFPGGDPREFVRNVEKLTTELLKGR